jgi:hypothetical protein
VQVFTAAGAGLAVNPAPPFIGIDERMFPPFVASANVRFAGDIAAIVLTSTASACGRRCGTRLVAEFGAGVGGRRLWS